jgi:ketosteroid isomerase-like protein
MSSGRHLGVLLVLLLATAAVAGPDMKARAAGARAAVRQADASRCAAVADRDLARFLSLLADDFAFFPDQAPVAEGKAAVRELLAPFFDPKGPMLRCDPMTVEVSGSADFAYTTSTYDEKGAAAERSPTRGHGKYVTIWKKARGGAWKVAVDIGNREPPPERDFGPPPPP